ncbi:hypothetical protein SCLCIDRAFT_1216739, partial [Scleroderma citrinum Foug A]
LGDYGHFTDSGDFCCEGNIFAEFKSLSSKANITPRQHKISEWGGEQGENDIVRACHYSGAFAKIYKPLGLSLPSNDNFRSLLVALSTRLINRYLITTVVQCSPNPCLSSSGIWYNIAKPFVWHRKK